MIGFLLGGSGCLEKLVFQFYRFHLHASLFITLSVVVARMLLIVIYYEFVNSLAETVVTVSGFMHSLCEVQKMNPWYGCHVCLCMVFHLNHRMTFFVRGYVNGRSQASTVSIAMDWMAEVQFLAGVRFFSAP
jgi:hypothetical protein